MDNSNRKSNALISSTTINYYDFESKTIRRRCNCQLLLLFFVNGKLNANVAPIPSALFSAHIVPPRASTILRYEHA
ncbi:MAG: hypothetical protein JO327_01375 [Nitrososphaeraceae archaeon]|nr:hypothetical protein [Nitrososphaeraceae archaeon]